MSDRHKDFFDSWQSIELPAPTDDIWDFLYAHYPNDWYILDYVPARIKDGQKYLQLEVRYADAE